MQKMDFIHTKTSDDLKLPGIYYPVDNKELCVLFVHGMSGFFLENYFGHVLGQQLQKIGIGYIFTHNRGYCHMNDISTSEKKEDSGFKTKRMGAVYERFEGCVPDIEAWLEKGRELGYKKFVVIGHSLGGPKVVHHYFKNKPRDVGGIIMASPGDMVGLVKKVEYQPDYEDLLAEAKMSVGSGNPEKILTGKIWESSDISAQTFLDLFEEGGPADNLPILRNPDRFLELESIDVPILCIMGEHDDIAIKTLLEDMALLKEKAIHSPSFKTHLLAGANHGYEGREKEFSEEIIKWINDTEL